MRRVLFALTTVAGLVLGHAPARADGLSADEHERLWQGQSVVREQSLQRGDRHYVGGVAYAVIDAPVDDVAALLDTVGIWRSILPKTRSTQIVGTVAGDALVEMTHGTALVQARYTMRVRREGPSVRFWMDPRRPHDIEDAWGFLRAEPAGEGRTLVTYGVLIDMGPGLMRDLFERRVRDAALSVPERVRDFVAEQGGRRASR